MSLRFPTLLSAFLAVSGAAAEPSGIPAALRRAGCLECHDTGHRKGKLDLEGTLPGFEAGAGVAFWQGLHERVRRGEMPPPDSTPPTAEARRALLDAVRAELAAEEIRARADGGRHLLRRLTRAEVENGIQAVLGTRRPLASLLPEDDLEDGLDRIASAQRLSASHLAAYLEAATVAADVLFHPGPRPEVRHLRIPMTERPAVKSQGLHRHGEAGPDGRIFRRVLRASGDGVWIFTDDPGAATRFPEIQSPWPGTWRIRVAAAASRPGPIPVSLALWAVGGDADRLLEAWEPPVGGPAVHAASVRLGGGEHLEIRATGCGADSSGRPVEEVGADAFGGPGWLLQSVEAEGPEPAEWPSPSLRRWIDGVARWRVTDDGRLLLESDDPKAALGTAVRRMAAEVFRRPVDETEVYGLLAVAGEPGPGPEGLAASLRRVLVEAWISPDFLFLREPVGPLDGPALASRLSHFLWSEAPDAPLRRLAETGALKDPEVLRGEAGRMLADARGRRLVRRFCAGWLDLRRIGETDPDRTLFPEFDPALQESMLAETEAFVAEVLASDLPVSALLDPGFAFVDARLARLYGIPGVYGDRVRKVALPAGLRDRRGGLLGQASVLKVTANGTTTSPVVRGAWVMHRLLGRVSPPPPPGVGSVEPDTRGATTFRRQLERHRDQASCAACHRHIDPAGLALENYDPIGGWRDAYRVQGPGAAPGAFVGSRAGAYALGPEVDATAVLPDGGRLAGPEDLRRWLVSQEPEIARTVARVWTAEATGAFPGPADASDLEGVLERARGRGLRTLLLEVVASRMFRER